MEESLIWVAGALMLSASVVFSLIEGALLFYSPTALKELLRREKKPKRLYTVAEQWDELFLLSRFLNHLVNILLVMLIAYYWWGLSELSVILRVLGATAVSVLLVFVVGELLPDAVGRWAAERVLIIFSGPMLALSVTLRPLTVSLSAVCRLTLRVFGIRAQEPPSKEAEEDILDALDEGERRGLLHHRERTMMEQVMELKEKTAVSVMTPRPDIVAIPADADFFDAVKTAKETGHSRIPVFEHGIDNIVGVLYVKDLLTYIGEGNEKPSVRKIMRKAYFVPESKHLSALLNEMRQGRTHLAIVVDEYGGTSGLLTVEDILEEIVGEIEDEHDRREAARLVRLDERTLIVDGRLLLDELARAVGFEIEAQNGIETVAGYIITETGRIPTKGEKIETDRVLFSVIDADARRIKKVKVTLKEV